MDSVIEKPYVRDRDDFFPTTADCIKAFQIAEGPHIPLSFWEPACGQGHICKMFEDRDVHATDLVDRGYGIPKRDFLMELYKPCDAIISNPPFKLLYEFIEHAFDLNVGYIAYFHRTTFLNTVGWERLWKRRPPARIYTLTWRPDIYGIGTPDQRCSFVWTVWDDRFDRYPGGCSFHTMERPE